MDILRDDFERHGEYDDDAEEDVVEGRGEPERDLVRFLKAVIRFLHPVEQGVERPIEYREEGYEYEFEQNHY